MVKTAFVFPGQGSQQVGMGIKLADAYSIAKQVLERIDDAITQDLSGLMRNGPADQLTLTENAQPALLASAMASLSVLLQESGKPIDALCHVVAGHSLGEYVALVAAGVIEMEDAAKLVKLRGRLMQQAVSHTSGAMAAIMGLDKPMVERIIDEAAQGEVLSIGNDNGGGQLVISGEANAVNRALPLAKQQGAKRAILLPVSAPFHCPLMQPVADEMAVALSKTRFHQAKIPVICNVTAQLEQDGERMRDLLIEQICGQVRWHESVETMLTMGVARQIELGTGKVLSGLAKRIAPDMELHAFGEPDHLPAILAALAN